MSQCGDGHWTIGSDRQIESKYTFRGRSLAVIENWEDEQKETRKSSQGWVGFLCRQTNRTLRHNLRVLVVLSNESTSSSVSSSSSSSSSFSTSSSSSGRWHWTSRQHSVEQAKLFVQLVCRFFVFSVRILSLSRRPNKLESDEPSPPTHDRTVHPNYFFIITFVYQLFIRSFLFDCL